MPKISLNTEYWILKKGLNDAGGFHRRFQRETSRQKFGFWRIQLCCTTHLYECKLVKNENHTDKTKQYGKTSCDVLSKHLNHRLPSTEAADSQRIAGLQEMVRETCTLGDKIFATQFLTLSRIDFSIKVWRCRWWDTQLVSGHLDWSEEWHSWNLRSHKLR